MRSRPVHRPDCRRTLGIKEGMPAWCRATGNEFLGLEEDDGQYRVYVRKGK